MIHRSNSVAATEQIAAALAADLRGGECISLNGPLGAGKTQFIRGLVAGVGGPTRRVCSPTFVLLNIYSGGRLTVYHLDAYRVTEATAAEGKASAADDFESIGFSELLQQGGIVAVEWGARVRSLLPPDCIEVTIEPVDETNAEAPHTAAEALPTARLIEIQRPVAP